MKKTTSWNTVAGVLGLSVGVTFVPAATAQPCAPSGWTQTLAEAGVPARSTTAIAQAAGNTLVLFGGFGSGTEYGDTWVFDGAAWTRRNVPGPSPRSQHVMTYDASRQRTVLFGGQGFGEAPETWEWDGAAWTQDSPTTSPPSILGAALGYDGINGRVILVGGTFAENGQPNPNCWSLNGTTWTNLGSLNGPALRSYAATTFDSARGRLVLFGGVSTSTFEDLSETWEFDGVQWEPVAFGPVSFSGLRPSLAFDPVRARVVLSGAFNNPGSTYEFEGGDWVEVSSTTPGAGLPVAYSAAAGHVVQLQAAPSQSWSWDGTSWSRLGPAIIPALNGHSLAYNATNGKAMLFGGTTFLGNTVGDLWSFEGNRWSLVSSDGPSPRDRAGLVYDSQRGGLVLFGGFASDFGGQGDTWIWTGSWNQLDIPGPPGRSGAAMAYNAARNQTVLFGGLDADFNRIGDTWVLQGSTWTQVETATGPAGRDRASMAYDPNRGKVVLFGGRDENINIGNDTWEFDGTTWSPVVSAGRPPARYAASLSYDASVGKLVLIGGLDENFVALDDAWVLDTVNGWQRIVSPNGLGPRTDHAATYVPSLGRTLLYGGYDDANTRGDTWQFAAGVVANVTQQPQGGSVVAGQTVVLSTAASADRAISYQWTFAGAPLANGPSGNGSTVSGATTPSLTLTNAQLNDSGRYACTISTACGFTLTNDAVLTVCEAAAPVLSLQPFSQQVCPAQGTSFSVDATGSGPTGLRFQWQFSDVAAQPPEWFNLFDGGIYSQSGDILAVIADTYLPTISFSPPDGATYPVSGDLLRLRCVVSSDCGSTASNAVLFTILEPSDPSCGGVACDPDVNQDGNSDQGDIDYLINVVAGGENTTNIDPDFNRDGNADQGDIDALLNVVAGGACP